MKIILTVLILLGFVSPSEGLSSIIKNNLIASNDTSSADHGADGPAGNCSGCEHC